MFIRVVSEQPVQRFGGVNVLAGRCRGRGPRDFHTPYSPGPARRQGPGRAPLRQRFGHVNVVRVGGLVRAHGWSCASVSSESRPCGRWDARACPRNLAVWPLESGRVASGLSPHGAASFYTLGWGSGVAGVEWSAIYPGPCPTPVPDSQQCPACPHPAGLRLPLGRASRCFSSLLVTSGFESRRLAAQMRSGNWRAHEGP